MRITFLMIALLSLSACSSLVDFISPPQVAEPTELQTFAPQVSIQTLWHRSISSKPDYLNLKPFWHEGKLYVAGSHGEVAALDAMTGKTLWQVNLDVALSAGPGVGEGLVLLGADDAKIIALDLVTGEKRWDSQVSSEVLATPVAAFGRVVVRTLDGRVVGLNTSDGVEQWQYARDMPTLSLRGVSSPVLSGLNVLCGMEGGKLVALDVRSGQPVWESTIAIPLGRSELSRMVDIDGDPLIYKGSVYVNAYQSGIVSLGEYSGTLLWRHELSSYGRPAVDGGELFTADDRGTVWSFDNQTGDVLWKQEAFQRRELSDMAVLGNYVAVGDYAGYVHFLQRQDGSLAARVRVGSEAIRKGMLSANGVLYVQGEGGELQALSLKL